MAAKKNENLTPADVKTVVTHPSIPGVTSETHPHIFKVDGTWETPESKPSAFKKDGTPTRYVDRAAILANRAAPRPVEERIKELEDRIVKAKERHAKELATMTKQLDNLKNGGGRGGRAPVDPVAAQAAARELLAGGMTAESIVALEAKLRLAKAAIAGKSAEELAALTAPPTPPVPDFLSAPVAAQTPAGE